MSRVKSGARAALRPLTQPVTSRFAHLQERADHTEALATTAVQKTEELQAGLWGLAAKLDEVGGRLELLFDQLNVDLQVMGEYARITERLGNRLEIHAGDLAERAGRLERDAAELRDLTRHSAAAERILGEPFALHRLADLEPGSRILTVGAGASTLPVTLASNGFRVTAVGGGPAPFAHPNLDSVGAPVDQWDGPGDPLQAVVCLSARPFGREVLRRFAFWLQPSGRLVLTTRLGTYSTADAPETAEAAEAAGDASVGTAGDDLADWTVVARRTYRQDDTGAWEEIAGETASRWSATERGFTVAVAQPR